MNTQGPIRLLIAGARPSRARTLEELLLAEREIQLVGESPEILRLAELAWKHAPQVILVHVRGAQFAIEAVREVLTQVPDGRLLVVLPSFDSAQAAEIIESGASGVLAVSDLFLQGLRAIKAISSGEIWASRTVLSQIVRLTVQQAAKQNQISKVLGELTQRESEIVKLLQQGSTNKEIAAQLSISDKTVKTHLHHIFSKLNVDRRHKIGSMLMGG